MPLLDATGLIDAPSVTLVEAGEGPAILVPGSTAPDTLLPLSETVELVAITFPAFTDGRGFSLAKALRHAGYAGRLRAVGELLPDQFAFALACGFDEVEIGEERLARQPVAQWLAALGSIGESYQASARVTDIFAARRERRAA